MKLPKSKSYYIKKDNPIWAWHFLPNDERLRFLHNGSRKEIWPGTKLSVRPPLELCVHGLHASELVVDALWHAIGSVCCRVKCWGAITKAQQNRRDKLVCQHREVIWMANIKWELHHYIQWLMEDAIKTYEKRFGKIKDDWIEALKIHKDWLYSRITTNETRKIVNNLLKSNDVRRHEAFTNSMVHVLKGEFLDTLRDVITPGCYKYNPLTMRTGAIRRYSIDLVRSLDIKRATTVEMEYADKLEEILVNLGGKDDPMHPSYKGVETV